MMAIKTSIIHKNKRFIVKEDLVKHKNEQVKNYKYVDKNNACLVILIYQNKVGLIKTSRYVINERESFELIGGKIEDNESPEECIIRELDEETNIKTSKIQHFFDTYPLPSLTTEKTFVFIAEIDNKKDIILDKEELINELQFFSKEELIQMVFKNKIKSSVDCLAISKYLLTKTLDNE